MALTFEPRADGFRVTDEGRMVASLCCKTITTVLEGNKAVDKYVDLPREECTLHSGIGPLPIKLIEEIIAQVK
jgi:hypothetical protein